MCLESDSTTFNTLSELIQEEIDLYSQEDLVILVQASLIMFCRCLLTNLR